MFSRARLQGISLVYYNYWIMSKSLNFVLDETIDFIRVQHKMVKLIIKHFKLLYKFQINIRLSDKSRNQVLFLLKSHYHLIYSMIEKYYVFTKLISIRIHFIRWFEKVFLLCIILPHSRHKNSDQGAFSIYNT